MLVLELQHNLRNKKIEKPKTATDFNNFFFVTEKKAVISSKMKDLSGCRTSYLCIN